MGEKPQTNKANKTMSDIIQLLPDSVANQIAAGEVIQRPASVIKELVENAVDAGATHIDVLVVDAGRTSIQVIDDGKGMTETDARLAFERHATSKIRKADDLFALHTMGFRGEALPSVVAVSQVDLRTRPEGEDVGTHLSIAGSRFQNQEPCACPVGSNFLVENLFYNVPARRKFLKSNATELNNIIAAFERIALVYNDINFTLRSNSAEVLNLKAANLHKRIIDIFGRKLDKDLIPIKPIETSICTLEGFVGKPESAKKKCSMQYFFVNGRYMRHPYFHKAVISAFDRLIPADEQVPYFLYFTVRPEDIDVNIHPTKTEIKFENEQAVWQILQASVKDAVGKFNNIPTIDFDTEAKPDIPVFDDTPRDISAPKVQYNPSYNPFKETPSENYRQPATPDNWDQLYEGLKSTPEPAEPAPDLFPSKASTSPMEEIVEEKSPAHYQFKGQYIINAVKSGLMFIDQHRAHIRILYEDYLRQLAQRKPSAQRMLFPEMVQFAPATLQRLPAIVPELEAMGFELSDLGSGSYSIGAVPTGLDGLSIPSLLQQMVDESEANASEVKEEIDRSLALTMARSAAIPVGQVLSNDEMENIVNRLFSCENVKYTPDGKPIVAILTQQEIARLFA